MPRILDLLGFGKRESSDTGESTAIREARERIELAEADLKLKAIDAQRKVLESYYYPSYTGTNWGDFVDPLDRFRDGDSLMQPLGVGGRKGAPREPPIAQNIQELAEIRAVARTLQKTNPIACGILEDLESFILGDGFTYRATSKDKANDTLVAQVQDVIDDFLDDNNWPEFEQELVRRSRRDGEYFLRYFGCGNGELQVRVIEPHQVVEPANCNDEWTFGIRHFVERDEHNHKIREDIDTVLAYWVSYDADGKGEEVDAAEIDHVKVNADRGVKRGLSDFFTTQDAIEGVRKLIRNMREGASVQAAIAWIEQYDSAAQSSVQSQINARAEYQRTAPSAQSGNTRTVTYQRYEPGTVLKVPAGKQYIPAPLGSNVPLHVGVVQASLRAVGCRWRMPEYMVSGDASNANYSSTLVAGSPFVRYIRKAQRFYKHRFLQTLWRAVDWAARCGRISGFTAEQVRELIEIQAECPSPEVANTLQDAQVDQIDMQAGVLSKQTRRQKRGLDDEQERINLQEDPPTPPGQPNQPGQLPGSQPATGGAGTLPFFPRARAASG